MSLNRIGTANMYDRTINNIAKQQNDLASQMEHASAGKRVLRPGDDPVAAAQAERARTRLTRMETDQRTLDAQTATIRFGEATLGEINSAVQEFRSLIVNAGNGAYNQTQRDTLVEQLQNLRNQILSYSNRKDSNGLPLFRGLDTESSTPFPAGTQGMQSGQTNVTEYTITNSLDGALAFFSGKTGNSILAIDRSDSKAKSWSDVGVISDPDKAMALNDAKKAGATVTPIKISFEKQTDGTITYKVEGEGTFDQVNKVWVPDGAAPRTGTFKSGEPILIQGMQVTITGEPLIFDEDGNLTAEDTYSITASDEMSIFQTLDAAIAAVKNHGNSDGTTEHGALAHSLAKSLAEIDTQLNRVSTVRGAAGDLLNQAERMSNTLLAQSEQMEAQRSAAEDIDMVAALSQLKTQETAVSAALQSYASIQKLSLFNYIN